MKTFEQFQKESKKLDALDKVAYRLLFCAAFVSFVVCVLTFI